MTPSWWLKGPTAWGPPWKRPLTPLRGRFPFFCRFIPRRPVTFFVCRGYDGVRGSQGPTVALVMIPCFLAGLRSTDRRPEAMPLVILACADFRLAPGCLVVPRC